MVSSETPAKLKRLLSNERISGLTQLSNAEHLKFEFFFNQPVDHKGTIDERFTQKVRYTHRGYDRPTVIITEGYKMSGNYIAELAEYLDANEIIVEHRYTGESIPESKNVSFLNLEQACSDYHQIRSFFNRLYSDHWIATGFSKGGQTAMAYKYFYPEDIVGSISYNSPLNLSTAEPRINAFFESVGTPECREKLIDFQRLVLSRKNDILPLFVDRLNDTGLKYQLTAEQVLEYMVLEYPYSFWQYGSISCDEIPGSETSLPLVLSHLQKLAGPELYATPNGYEYAFWQFYSELGYYEHVTKNVEDLLSGADYSNARWMPEGVEPKFNDELMNELKNWIETDAENMIFLYGANDPWSASAVYPKEANISKTFSLKSGNHSTRISDFEDTEREDILNLIKSWYKPL